jgi:hypothetical protein
LGGPVGNKEIRQKGIMGSWLGLLGKAVVGLKGVKGSWYVLD